MKYPLKKKSTKIIQIAYSEYSVCGLGDDDNVYKWDELYSRWYLYGEIDDQI